MLSLPLIVRKSQSEDTECDAVFPSVEGGVEAPCFDSLGGEVSDEMVVSFWSRTLTKCIDFRDFVLLYAWYLIVWSLNFWAVVWMDGRRTRGM